jgi:hypothetical protein
MKKKTFVPAPDQLEGRIALSGGPKFINGAAILTTRDLGRTHALVENAVNHYANHGQNLNRLQADLATAINRVPFHRRDGLLTTVQSEARKTVSDTSINGSASVRSALQRVHNHVNNFVQGQIARGVMVVR